MISLPDELLERLDRLVEREGATRSGLLGELAAREVERKDESRRRRVKELLANPGRHGSGSVDFIREMRRSR